MTMCERVVSLFGFAKFPAVDVTGFKKDTQPNFLQQTVKDHKVRALSQQVGARNLKKREEKRRWEYKYALSFIDTAISRPGPAN